MYDLIIFLVLLSLGYGFGRWLESRHYQSIIRREKELQSIGIFAAKLPPVDMLHSSDSALVQGSVVVSVDYFKRFLAGLRGLIGGRMKSYETLIDRGRREAILRMKADAEAHGAERIFNVKLETASISKGQRNRIGSVEVLAYGTALIPR